MLWFHTSRTQPHSAAIVGISFCSRLLDLFGGKNLTDSGASRDPYRSQLITIFVLPSRLLVVVVASRVKLVRYRRWTHTMRLFLDACSLPKFVWLRLFQGMKSISSQAYHTILSGCVQLACRLMSMWSPFHLSCNRTLYLFLLRLNTMIRCPRIREKKSISYYYSNDHNL